MQCTIQSTGSRFEFKLLQDLIFSSRHISSLKFLTFFCPLSSFFHFIVSCSLYVLSFLPHGICLCIRIKRVVAVGDFGLHLFIKKALLASMKTRQ